MADLTYSGSGVTVPANTKQVTDLHATRGNMPVVKIAYGAEGDATFVGADANGLDVDVTRMPALATGTNSIGQVTANAGTNLNTSTLATEATLDGRLGSLTETAPATDTASSGLNGRLQRIAQRLTSLIALFPAALGAGGGLKVDGSGTALPVSGTLTVSGVATESTLDTRTGSLTETAPATDTASSGINGRLQRIAQRITSEITLLGAGLPAALVGGRLDVNVGAALPAGTANIGDVDVLTVPAPLSTTGGGTEATALRVTVATDSTGVLSVDDNGGSLTVDGTVAVSGTVTVGSHAVTNAGTFAVQAAGDVAHDSADSGSPVKVGGIARQTNPTAVADVDRVNATFDDIGRQVVVVGQVRDLVGHQHTQIASSSAETTVITAGGAGVFQDLVCLVLTNQTATAVNVTIKDATAGTTRMIIALAASGGAVIPFPRPVKQASAANNWTVTLSSAAVTVNVFAQFESNV